MLTNDPELIRSILSDRQRQARDDALGRLARLAGRCCASLGRPGRLARILGRRRRPAAPATSC